MIRQAPRAARASRGQTIVIFALGSLVFFAALGLVLDAGYDFAQRRAMQNSADAAALAGARGIYYRETPAAILAGARTLALHNGLQDAALLTCIFVSNSDAELGDCGAVTGVPVAATGVAITVSETHGTFALRAVGVGSSGTRASATAHVEAIPTSAFDAGASPFIVCGYRTLLDDGGMLSILQTDGDGVALVANGQALLNPAAVGQTFLIHGPQIATCNTQGNRFKGDNDQDANHGVTVSPGGTTIDYQPGVRSGPMRSAVHAASGCSSSANDPGPCIMILPIADNVDADCGNCTTINVVGFAAFEVSDASANSNTAKLLDNVVLQSVGTLTWTSDTPGMVAIRLTK